mmetsp:Transcript_47350/g.91405  ORF Transcript_47350/g.91405 Transcript_47350/m.91405 type:complete len:204 (+) Transcript_47350:43-654(+)
MKRPDVEIHGKTGWGVRPVAQPGPGLAARGIFAEELLVVSAAADKQRLAALSQAGAAGSWGEYPLARHAKREPANYTHRVAKFGIAPQSDDYLDRMARFGVASRFSVEEASRRPGCMWLDVRGNSEDGVEELPVPALHCSLAFLEARVPELLPNKETPVICFCSSGELAREARAILLRLGYNTVLNAGGCFDLNALWLKPGRA